MGWPCAFLTGGRQKKVLFVALSSLGLLAALLINVAVALPYVRTADTDFTRYVVAARHILGGKSPYQVPDYDYPPLLAVLLVPFASLDLHLLHWLWLTCNVAASFATAFIFAKRWGATPETWAAVSITWGTLGALPQNLALGQVNPLLLLLMAIWWTERERRPARAGLLLGVAAALKIWPVLLFLADIVARNRKSLTYGLGALLVGSVGPFLLLRTVLSGPPSPSTAWYWLGTPSIFCLSFSGFVLRLVSAPSQGQPFPAEWVFGNTPSGLLQAGFSPNVWRLLGLASVPFVLVCILLWKTRKNLARLPTLLVPGFLITISLVLMPLVWAHYYLVQYPMLSHFLAVSLRRRQWLKALAVLTLGACLTWVPTFGLSVYVQAFGWTYAKPAVFWALTIAPFMANLMLLLLIVRASQQAPEGENAC